MVATFVLYVLFEKHKLDATKKLSITNSNDQMLFEKKVADITEEVILEKSNELAVCASKTLTPEATDSIIKHRELPFAIAFKYSQELQKNQITTENKEYESHLQARSKLHQAINPPSLPDAQNSIDIEKIKQFIEASKKPIHEIRLSGEWPDFYEQLKEKCNASENYLSKSQEQKIKENGINKNCPCNIYIRGTRIPIETNGGEIPPEYMEEYSSEQFHNVLKCLEDNKNLCRSSTNTTSNHSFDDVFWARFKETESYKNASRKIDFENKAATLMLKSYITKHDEKITTNEIKLFK